MATKKAGTRAFTVGLEENIMVDLETLQQKALETGAAAAEILPASQVVVDERVRLKCTVPRCLRAGETPNCPPYAPDLELVKKAFARFSWSMLLKTHVEPIEGYDPDKDHEQSLLFHQKTGEVVYEVEHEAYKLGYHLAMGFGGGSCKDYLCRGLLCQSLDGGRCRFPLRSPGRLWKQWESMSLTLSPRLGGRHIHCWTNSTRHPAPFQ